MGTAPGHFTINLLAQFVYRDLVDYKPSLYALPIVHFLARLNLCCNTGQPARFPLPTFYKEGRDFVLISHQEIRMQRKASAVWKGGLKDGKGTVSSASGVLANTPYSFTTRFEGTPGTNPEELIAAAHAACFSMALSAQLGGAKLMPESISTSATLTMENIDGGWTITRGAPGCGREGARRERGSLQHRSPKCKSRLPGIEGAEREDHNGCEAGLDAFDFSVRRGLPRLRSRFQFLTYYGRRGKPRLHSWKNLLTLRTQDLAQL